MSLHVSTFGNIKRCVCLESLLSLIAITILLCDIKYGCSWFLRKLRNFSIFIFTQSLRFSPSLSSAPSGCSFFEAASWSLLCCQLCTPLHLATWQEGASVRYHPNTLTQRCLNFPLHLDLNILINDASHFGFSSLYISCSSVCCLSYLYFVTAFTQMSLHDEAKFRHNTNLCLRPCVWESSSERA